MYVGFQENVCKQRVLSGKESHFMLILLPMLLSHVRELLNLRTVSTISLGSSWFDVVLDHSLRWCPSFGCILSARVPTRLYKEY